jgi:quercetin dioxygenase-like cupin family protein
VQPIHLRDKFGRFHDHWNPRILAGLNGQHVKAVKFQGEFVWHSHAAEDEMFLVVRGAFRRGVEHRPVAEHEVEVLLFGPAPTRNTGNVTEARTVEECARI